MGYGKRALQLLCQYYNSETNDSASLNESRVMPLLYELKDSPPERLEYIGVSYGLTTELLKFWKRAGFVPLYIRQTTSDVTGEHSCVMVKSENQWLKDFYSDFSSRFVSLLPSAFKSFSGSLALSVLHCKHLRPIKGLSAAEMQWFVGPLQLKRLAAYSNNLIDHHLILDVLPGISKLYFSGHLGSHFLSSLQEVILLCIGLQNKSIEMTSNELNMEPQQVMGCFRKAVKKIVNYLNSVFLQNSNKSSKEKEET
ncbi:RNA cytidine acetyltransferase [Parasteatoda tepidariorum]|uniref:RNA cytidine acetyltransferase n=1 Tax=Parasteatoda tepidariorum TaxID=114398 RepID=UPI0039BC9A79